MPMNRTFKQTHGFTLIELLLGLAIAAIVGVCIYNMFWSAMKIDDKMRRVHENYLELLIANQGMTHDLENATHLDFSGSYLNAKNFVGEKDSFSFLTQTSKGIKHVRYFSGLLDNASITKTMIGRVVNPSSDEAIFTKENSPVEFLLRQESSLADWLNETTNDTTTQIVAAGLKKETFNCQYAPFEKDIQFNGSSSINFSDTWDEKALPMEVSCSFMLYDFQNPSSNLMFKRDIFLAPMISEANE
jgi:prepilin-type N-terminal cleavage/methylation domain-containing protein